MGGSGGRGEGGAALEEGVGCGKGVLAGGLIGKGRGKCVDWLDCWGFGVYK